jgi:hypothetical protein
MPYAWSRKSLRLLWFVGIRFVIAAQGNDDEPHLESVSFQGQRPGEHYTMQVEEGHAFRCFETKEELVDAVDRYNGYNHIDVDLAEKYGWPIGKYCTVRTSTLLLMHAVFVR